MKLTILRTPAPRVLANRQVLTPAPSGLGKAQVVALVTQLLLALQHLHARAVVHRDIKVPRPNSMGQVSVHAALAGRLTPVLLLIDS